MAHAAAPMTRPTRAGSTPQPPMPLANCWRVPPPGSCAGSGLSVTLAMTALHDIAALLCCTPGPLSSARWSGWAGSAVFQSNSSPRPFQRRTVAAAGRSSAARWGAGALVAGAALPCHAGGGVGVLTAETNRIAGLAPSLAYPLAAVILVVAVVVAVILGRRSGR